ncbi:MAG: hypothetical protein Ct9H300mP12_13040 [Acidimicrobiales bacterium]|nr:MAG: hypothetical protein Ct9H300mP12_13040 [Acidimicrobiales bacterium]
MAFQRAGAVDDDDRFVEMVVNLFLERSFPKHSRPYQPEFCRPAVRPASPDHLSPSPGRGRQKGILGAMNHARIATEALRFPMGTFSAQADSPPA